MIRRYEKGNEGGYAGMITEIRVRDYEYARIIEIDSGEGNKSETLSSLHSG